MSNRAQGRRPGSAAKAAVRPGPSNNGAGSTFNLRQFETECLEEHNRYRAIHGCPPLTMNRNLCAYATEWAKILASKNIMEHRTEGKYGENLFMSHGFIVDGKLPVKMWYDEIEKYDFNKPSFTEETGHFTQLVWKGSKQVGIGVQIKGTSVWVVANYDPPGNYINEFGDNVPRPGTAAGVRKSNTFNLKQFTDEFVEEHNRLRALHNCPPLQLNPQISQYSAQWAKNLGQKNIMEHRVPGKYGENLFMSTGYIVDGKLPVKMWYDEIGKYNFRKPGFSPDTGHFTQVIWKNSKQMGVGVFIKGNSVWVVANYDPPGNFTDQFAQNVPMRA